MVGDGEAGFFRQILLQLPHGTDIDGDGFLTIGANQMVMVVYFT